MLRAGARFLYAGLVMAMSLLAAAQPLPDTAKVNEFYVRYKAQPSGPVIPEPLLGIQRATTLSFTVSMPLEHVRTLRDGAYVMRSDRVLTRVQAWELAEKLAHSDGVAVAQPIDPEFNARPPARPGQNMTRPRVGGGAK
jgi:hypothetical protein